jgi:transcription elongation GreA/GreB family factor
MTMSDAGKLQFKQDIKDTCRSMLMQRIATAQTAMQQAQESANTEDKSSAGDKHETSRAMSQIESEMNAKQLAQAQRDLEALEKLNTSIIHEKILPGAVVVGGEQTFFIGCGLGIVAVDDKQVIALSPQAPLATQLMNKKKGDKFPFKGKQVMIEQVF